ncbi:hypothetical protein N7468_006625 [Penicillium chermesinum]|uniref:Uncharacterized protein n=1 Tax=Penicillium chermesinum TaxID=63820 RepID=A0A9W9NSM9_9EURO|nr:uncharacterized protein N7468_006625 [Penicillium chermesinum]KAJ5225400.1 hypothetical protein N7468_006625 [Penicillium chermesinum]
MVTKILSAKARYAQKWTEDFNATGDIKAERVPLDPSPLFYAFGVPCIALYRGYYILAGFQALRSYGRSANVKNNATIKTAQKDWLIGPLLASTDFVNTQVNLIRIYHDETAQKVTARLKSEANSERYVLVFRIQIYTGTRPDIQYTRRNLTEPYTISPRVKSYWLDRSVASDRASNFH